VSKLDPDSTEKPNPPQRSGCESLNVNVVAFIDGRKALDFHLPDESETIFYVRPIGGERRKVLTIQCTPNSLVLCGVAKPASQDRPLPRVVKSVLDGVDVPPDDRK